MVFEHAAEYGSQWAAVESIAGKIGCTAETLWRWVRQAERDSGQREGLKHRRANASRPWSAKCSNCARPTLGKASAYFAQAELDRRFKP